MRYPFGKYDQLFVPEFNAGAMENAGCVTFREDYVFRSRVTDARYERRGETILHEMAHMWFGDLVTMRWWDDLWLNESFATYASMLCQTSATRWTDAWATFANAEKTWAYRQDQLPSTHPIATDAPDVQTAEVNFDGITYAKGASVLKQLGAYVGVDAFLAGLREYFTEHAYGNTTLADLLRALEKSSGRDLGDWSKAWLETAGISTLHPEFTVDADGAFASFDIVQSAPTEVATSNTLRPHRLAVGLYDEVDGRLVRTERVELDVAGERTAVAELIGKRRPALLLVNDDDLTYCKLRLDDVSLRTLRSGGIAKLESPLARTLCWSAAWDMTRDGELATHDYVALVVAGAVHETDIGVMQSLTRQALRALEIYADPASAADGLRRTGGRRALGPRRRDARLGLPAGLGARTARRHAHGRRDRVRARPARRLAPPPRAWPSTTTCGGRSSRRCPRSARSVPTRSTPSSSATRRPPVSARRRPLGRCSPRPRPRPRPGEARWRTNSCRTRCTPRSSPASPTPPRASCSGPTSSGTSPTSAASGSGAPTSWRRASSSGSSPRGRRRSTRRRSRRPTPSCPSPTSRARLRRLVSEGRADVERALAARAADRV